MQAACLVEVVVATASGVVAVTTGFAAQLAWTAIAVAAVALASAAELKLEIEDWSSVGAKGPVVAVVVAELAVAEYLPA